MEDERVRNEKTPAPGMVSWVDLTVRDAPAIMEFYKEVIGWIPESVSMGEYDDFTMNAPGRDAPAASICHGRGTNADLPPQWLIYVVMENLERSIEQCAVLGGELLAGPKSMGERGSYCVLRDPAEAVVALFEHGTRDPPRSQSASEHKKGTAVCPGLLRFWCFLRTISLLNYDSTFEGIAPQMGISLS